MKILHVIGSFVPAYRYGGPIKSVSLLCQELSHQGHTVTVVTTNVDGPFNLNVPLNQPVMMEGVSVWYFQVQSPRFYTFSLPIASALNKMVKDFDLVHIHTVFNWPASSAAFLCRKYGIPYVISPRGVLSPTCLNKSAIKKRIYSFLIERENLNGAGMIHFTSEEERLQALPFGFNAPSVVVPNGLNMKEFAVLPPSGSFRKKYPKTQGKHIILFFGRVCWIKGLDVLVDAFSIVAKQRNDAHLVIAGPDDEGYGDKVRTWINGYGINDKVTFTAMLTGKEKLEAFVDADVFCLPSYHENFGMAVAEVMACGLPIIISDQVGIHEEVSEAQAGVVTRCDAREVASALLRFLESEELRKEAGRNGRRLAEEKYSIDTVAKQMVGAYERVAGSREVCKVM